MKNLYFFDVDGTLIDYGRGITDISEGLKAALKEIHLKGDSYFVCTGRAHGTLPDCIREMGADGYSLCAGSFVTVGERVLRNVYFRPETLLHIMERFEKYEVMVMLEAGTDLYSNVMDFPEGERFLSLWGIKEENIKPIPSEAGKLKVNKLSVTFRTREESEIMADFPEKGITVLPQPAENSFDLTLTGCTKKDGIKAIVEYYGLKDGVKVYAFGDNYNDLEMIEYADVGVAMGNAVSELKDRAGFIAPSVEEDGVFEALKELGAV